MIEEILYKNIEMLKKQIKWLEYSYEKCKNIDFNNATIDDYDTIETLSARYARTIDFLIRKVWRAIDENEFEIQGTLIDVVNNALKRNLIRNDDDIKKLKNLRNDIAHEYIEENSMSLFKDLIEFTPILIEISLNTINYVDKKAF